MSQTISPGTERPNGVQRICRIWEQARSTFYNKVWARLRVRDNVHLARTRVLRIMRENHLLSPHRSQPRPLKKHDGKIITLAPDLMWGTDGFRVFTSEEGWVWIFSAGDHWNAECVG